MFRFKSFISIVFLTIFIGVPLLVTATEAGLEVQHQNEIAYVSGGVGDEEQKAIDELGAGFGLKLTFATQDGHYLGGGKVLIQDSQGNSILDVATQGPIFYADLEPGTYTVTAEPLEYAEQREQQTVEIGEGQTVLHFSWEK